MDNLDSGSLGNEDLDKPIPFDDETGEPSISHSPLSLGGGSGAGVPEVEIPKPAAKPAEKMVSSDRITGFKTFFTKLHVGSLDFLDGQITSWLKDNPGIIIKRTNTATGMLVGKKTEPNIIITVWY